MIREFCKQRYTSLEEELNLYEDMGISPVKKLSGALTSVTKALDDLKGYIQERPFEDAGEEIWFFKYEKPRFFAQQIFLLEQFTIENQRPKGEPNLWQDFYRNELKFVFRFFEQYKFQYGYFEMGATELDDQYFLRNMEPVSMVMPVLPDRDPEFSTNADYLFAKFTAYEMLRDDLLSKLKALDPTLVSTVVTENDLPELRWTGDKINLVEVIYALYFTGQINHGNADISLLIRFMEKYLHIDLSRAYRDFIDIRNRKVSSPTRFIDQMRESIHKRVDDDLTFRVEKRRGKLG